MNKTRSRLLIGLLVAVMALTGVLIGTVSADDAPAGQRDSLIARVAEILGLDQQDVEDAFQQALNEQREERRQQMETARETRIQELIEQGVITQQQADEWHAWLESRPDNSDERREWFESRPDLDIDGSPGMRAFGGRMAPGRSGRMTPGGFGGGCPAWSCPVAPDAGH
ncbi:MAG: hypothetical protein ACOC9B_05305 [Chloroflexota bacterium]